MREIKFRAWDKESKQLIPVSEMRWQWDKHGGRFFCSQCNGELENGKLLKYDVEKDLSVMQYTSLQDKNGNDIYEGDILDNVNLAGVYEVKDIFDVNYDVREMIIDVKTGEIVGNIYENSNLIKK